MSKIIKNHVFTSESVSEGHPDKICDQASDAVLDACLSLDPESRVACETATTTNLLMQIGEITCNQWDKIEPEALARKVIHDIGYNRRELEFSSQTFEYACHIHPQSCDISQGVTEGEGLYEEQGAGDQGMMFGYATKSTPALMPAPIYYSHQLLDRLQTLRKTGQIHYLRPDAKTQVSVLHENGVPVKITSVVISHQTDEMSLEKIQSDLTEVTVDFLNPTGLIDDSTQYYINPTGRFVIGGPHGDAGLTGRKIIVDTYGGVGCHGGGAFSGKDPSKVDRSAAYYARYAAKNIVAAGLADKCEIQVAYAIGMPRPLSINVETFGTGKVDESVIQDILENGEIFDFRPAALIKDLDLTRPKGWCYQDTAALGHFGRDIFPWERTDRIDALKQATAVH
ncbi:MAG: methionine adenosyltransferase [Proteobacteria bacterium]|nr:methionine adenosyltransferase [Pseudomonadota bacterium]MBU1386533.1 methionine adenosyltransferase [Pseudomonadota bacterium]MBU1544644.1 methionine adenosyltransferase [Pseudomonadota bacterium]MBU2431123.1 methionine adenosyltransferase [Pseudomonadota bacterium]MBU2481377.1 methionine adenosyltransferase [Pseudomonadota bacterium]